MKTSGKAQPILLYPEKYLYEKYYNYMFIPACDDHDWLDIFEDREIRFLYWYFGSRSGENHNRRDTLVS